MLMLFPYVIPLLPTLQDTLAFPGFGFSFQLSAVILPYSSAVPLTWRVGLAFRPFRTERRRPLVASAACRTLLHLVSLYRYRRACF